MSLRHDLVRWYEEECAPPDGQELDWFKDPETGEFVKGDTETEQVSYETKGKARWGNRVQIVYRRGGEYIAVGDVEPATEMQDWGDYGDPEIYEVKPVEVTVTKYERV